MPQSSDDRAFAVLSFWASLFLERLPEHYVFPSERYGLVQRKDEHKGATQVCVHSTDPAKPVGRWKEAWESAKARAGVVCRFHVSGASFEGQYPQDPPQISERSSTSRVN